MPKATFCRRVKGEAYRYGVVPADLVDYPDYFPIRAFSMLTTWDGLIRQNRTQ